MELVKQNLRMERVKRGFSYSDLANITKIAKSTLQRYETGTTAKIPLEAIIKIATALSIPPARLMGWEGGEHIHIKHGVKIPVYESYKSSKQQDIIIDYVEISKELAKQGEHFAYHVSDDNMEPRMQKGDIVIIRKQETANSEDMVLYKACDNEATIKKLVKHDNGISLVSLNTAYHPIFYTSDEVKNLPIKIYGKVVELRGKF